MLSIILNPILKPILNRRFAYLRTWPGRKRRLRRFPVVMLFAGCCLPGAAIIVMAKKGSARFPTSPTWRARTVCRSGNRCRIFDRGSELPRVMQSIAEGFPARASADLAAYYAMLPTASDPQDNRTFPQAMQDPSRASVAIRLIVFGDGQRGIPPCQSCHGPVSYVKGAPPLATQNASYLEQQLEHFSSGSRANDINVRMRSIARQLTAEEKAAVSEYYGAGLGPGVNSR